MENPFLTQDSTTASLKGLTLSDAAFARCTYLLGKEGGDAVIRVKVIGGGCSGFQYTFDIDTKVGEDDFIVERGTVRLVCDKNSLTYIDGGVVDFVDSLTGSYFTIENPNATANCGCGTSFSV